MENSVDPVAFRRFVKYLCIASNNISDRKKAKHDLNKHVVKIKKIYSGPKINKKKIEKELSELDRKINKVIETESKLLIAEKVDHNSLTQLTGKIKSLEKELKDSKKDKQKIVKLNEDISELQNKLKEMRDYKAVRQKRIDAIEKKIRESFSSGKGNLKNIEQRISFLQKRLSSMEKNKQYDPGSINRLKEKINILKFRADELKNLI